MTFIPQSREVARFQSEPAQMPAGVVGKSAFLRLGFERRGERTVLAEMERRSPLLVQQALYWDEAMPNLACVYIITTSGCILQGDRFAIEIELAPEARAYVTTQAATKIHSMDANYATQTQHIVLHDNSYLEYIPDPVIPHSHSRFTTATQVSMAASATLFYSEILMPGRRYHGRGELFQYDLYSCSVRAERPEGRELFTEKFIIEPQARDVRNAGVMGPFDVFANVLLLTPKPHADRIMAQIDSTLNMEEKIAAGASRLPHDAGLVFKVLGMETEPVRAKVREFWGLARQTVMSAPLPPQVAWR